MAKAPKANTGLKNAIKSADFRPKRLTAMDDAVRRLHLGTLVGEAYGTFFQPDINDPTNTAKMQEGIVGVFQFSDAITSEVIRAPKLWVPETISDPVKRALRTIDPETGEVTENKNVKVQLAFEVYAIRSSAALGYTWLFEPVFDVEPEANDPIAAIMKRKDALALPAPETVVRDEVPAEPEKEPAKKGK